MPRLLVATLSLLIVTPAFAQDTGSTRPSWTARLTRADAERRASMIFGQLDRNQDGFITQDEIDTFTRMMGDNPRVVDRVTKMITDSDANRDGKVSADEAKVRADAAFDAADANHDGILTAEERHAARATTAGQPPQQYPPPG